MEGSVRPREGGMLYRLGGKDRVGGYELGTHRGKGGTPQNAGRALGTIRGLLEGGWQAVTRGGDAAIPERGGTITGDDRQLRGKDGIIPEGAVNRGMQLFGGRQLEESGRHLPGGQLPRGSDTGGLRAVMGGRQNGS